MGTKSTARVLAGLTVGLLVVGGIVAFTATDVAWGRKIKVPTGNAEVLTSVSPADIEGVLNGLKLTFKRMDEQGRAYLLLADGMKILLATQNEGKTLHWQATFSGKVSPAKINAWNRQVCFCRAYLDGDGDPVIEFDLDLTAGVTRAAVERFVKMGAACVKLFARAVVASGVEFSVAGPGSKAGSEFKKPTFPPGKRN